MLQIIIWITAILNNSNFLSEKYLQEEINLNLIKAINQEKISKWRGNPFYFYPKKSTFIVIGKFSEQLPFPHEEEITILEDNNSYLEELKSLWNKFYQKYSISQIEKAKEKLYFEFKYLSLKGKKYMLLISKPIIPPGRFYFEIKKQEIIYNFEERLIFLQKGTRVFIDNKEIILKNSLYLWNEEDDDEKLSEIFFNELKIHETILKKRSYKAKHLLHKEITLNISHYSYSFFAEFWRGNEKDSSIEKKWTFFRFFSIERKQIII